MNKENLNIEDLMPEDWMASEDTFAVATPDTSNIATDIIENGVYPLDYKTAAEIKIRPITLVLKDKDGVARRRAAYFSTRTVIASPVQGEEPIFNELTKRPFNDPMSKAAYESDVVFSVLMRKTKTDLPEGRKYVRTSSNMFIYCQILEHSTNPSLVGKFVTLRLTRKMYNTFLQSIPFSDFTEAVKFANSVTLQIKVFPDEESKYPDQMQYSFSLAETKPFQDRLIKNEDGKLVFAGNADGNLQWSQAVHADVKENAIVAYLENTEVDPTKYTPEIADEIYRKLREALDNSYAEVSASTETIAASAAAGKPVTSNEAAAATKTATERQQKSPFGDVEWPF